MQYDKNEIEKGVFLISCHDGSDVRYGLATETGFQLKPMEYLKITNTLHINNNDYLILQKEHDYIELMQVKTLLELREEAIEIGDNPTLKRKLYK